MKKDVDDATVAAAMASRLAELEADVFPSPLFADTFEEVVADTLEDEDLESLWAEQKASAVRRQVAKDKVLAGMSAPAGPVALSSGAPQPPSQARKRPVPWVVGRGLSQREAKPLFPPGISVSKDLKHHFRWIARFDWMRPAVTKTFSASEHGTDNSALLYCLSHSWARYAARTGGECPWHLDDSLL